MIAFEPWFTSPRSRHAATRAQAVHDTRVRSSGQEAFVSKRWPLDNSLEGKRGAIEAVQSKPDSLGCPVFFPPQRAQVRSSERGAAEYGSSICTKA